MITTQKELRAYFWTSYPAYAERYYKAGKRQNQYPADVRMAWVDFVDGCSKDGSISEALADRATL